MIDFLPNVSVFAFQEASQQGNPWTMVIMMAGIFVIFYFLMIRPQQKRQKELKQQIENISKGDKFITAGGIYATVVSIKEHVVTAKIADDVKVDIAKSAISAVLPKDS